MLQDVSVLCWVLGVVVGMSSTPPPPRHPVVWPTLTCPTLSQVLTIFCGYFCHHHLPKNSLREVDIPRSCHCQDCPVQHHLQHLPTYQQHPVAPVFPLSLSCPLIKAELLLCAFLTLGWDPLGGSGWRYSAWSAAGTARLVWLC